MCGLAMMRIGAVNGAAGSVSGNEIFEVQEIRLEGLQRIAEGTVYNYLPLNIGDRLDSRRVAEAIRALYATGFFQDVELRREGGALIVAVMERPVIESFEIKGNKDISTEDLQKSLRNVGLASGNIKVAVAGDELHREAGVTIIETLKQPARDDPRNGRFRAGEANDASKVVRA